MQDGERGAAGGAARVGEQMSEIVLEVTPERRIVRIVIQDVDGASTEYRFTEQKEDVAVADSRFEFKPPAGTEVVEGEWASRLVASGRKAGSSLRSE